jgi:chromosomal replication initiator protein
MPDDVTRFVSLSIKKSICELEGALTRLQGFSALMDKAVDRETAEAILKDAATPLVKIERIQKMVAKMYSLSVRDLKARTKRIEVVFPRQLAMYLACTMTDLSTPDIGKAFGGRYQSTTIAARDKIRKMLMADPFFVEMVNKLIDRIRRR